MTRWIVIILLIVAICYGPDLAIKGAVLVLLGAIVGVVTWILAALFLSR